VGRRAHEHLLKRFLSLLDSTLIPKTESSPDAKVFVLSDAIWLARNVKGVATFVVSSPLNNRPHASLAEAADGWGAVAATADVASL
jgi:hypothetical protein